MMVAALLFVIVSCPAPAQQRPPIYGECASPTTAPDARIAACSSIIQSGRDSGRNLAVSYFNRGLGWLKKEEPDRAIADFDQAISIWPIYAAAYGARGSAYLGKSDFERALADTNRSIELQPNLAPSYGVRAAVYVERCALDQAVSEANRSIALNPRLPMGYNVRGSAFLRKGETDRAIQDFDRTLGLEPRYAPAFVNLGLAYARKGELDRAIAQLNQAIQIAPRRWTGYLGRGNVYGKMKDLDRALSDFDMAIRLAPTRAPAYHSRGYTWLHKQDFDRAIDDFTRSIKLDPRYAPPLTGRGLAYQRKGSREQAIKDFKAALATPLKCGADKWAHDTARLALAALTAPAVSLPPASGISPSVAKKPDPEDAQAQAGSNHPPAPSAAKPRTHAETVAECNRLFPGAGDSIIPSEGPKPPQCFRSFLNLECRFRGLSDRAGSFKQSIDRLRSRNYPRRQGPEMCSIKRSDVEADYQLSNQVQAPVTQLQKDYEIEFTCLNQFSTWLNDLPCAKDEPNCDVRKESVRRLVEDRLKTSREMAGQVSSDLVTATRTVDDIRAFWRIYSPICN